MAQGNGQGFKQVGGDWGHLHRGQRFNLRTFAGVVRHQPLQGRNA